jgi:hypothetical protein
MKLISKPTANILKAANWEVEPNGRRLTLYRNDFDDRTWSDVCWNLDTDTEVDWVEIIFVAKKTSNP